MAQPSRVSLDSEPDLVAYDSSSILPAAGSGYSYGPPPSMSPSDNMSRQSLSDGMNNSSGNAQESINSSASAGSPGFSNRSRARATSMASKFSNATLPLYSARDAASSGPSQQASSSSTPHNSTTRHRNSTNSDNDDSHHGEHDDDSDYEDCSEDDDDLEMDTLNKNSGGKGGWKMVANNDTPLSSIFSPSSHTHPPPGRRSMSDEGAVEHHEKLSNGHNQKSLKNSRFERFDRMEIIAMLVSLALVTFLTIASLHICFNGE